jgi:hypothetical protein
MSEIQFSSANNYAAVVHLSPPSTLKIKPIGCGITIVDGALVSRNFDNVKDNCIISFGTVARSRDGEVRSPLINYAAFKNLIEDDLWDSIEEFFIRITANWSIDTYFYFSPLSTKAESEMFRKWFYDERLDFYISMTHFYLAATLYHARTDSISLNWLSELPNLPQILVELPRKQSTQDSPVYDLFRKYILSTAVVLKMVPLTVNEFIHWSDIRYRAWRELYAHQRIGALQSQDQSLKTYFSHIFTQYFPIPILLSDADQHMFTNPFIVARYTASDSVRKINEQVRVAFDHEPAAPTSTAIESSANDYHKREYATMLRNASNDITMSGYVVGIRSFFASVGLNRIDVQPPVGELMEFVFHWSCALYTIHRCGIIHSDVHIGNINIRGRTTTFDSNIVIANHYYFCRYKSIGRLLDFSRAIINPYSLSARNSTHVSPDVIAREESEILERLYLQLFPRASQNAAKIRQALSQNFERAFEILAILDEIFMLRALHEHYAENKEFADWVASFMLKCEDALSAAIEHNILSDTSCENMTVPIMIEMFHMQPVTATVSRIFDVDETIAKIAPAHSVSPYYDQLDQLMQAKIESS